MYLRIAFVSDRAAFRRDKKLPWDVLGCIPHIDRCMLHIRSDDLLGKVFLVPKEILQEDFHEKVILL